MARVEITATHDGAGTVHVDGHDISRGVQGVTVDLHAIHPPRVELTLHVHDVTRLGVDGAEILIPEDTRAALLALGWTPPAEESIHE